jgi:hypothetical protein
MGLRTLLTYKLEKLQERRLQFLNAIVLSDNLGKVKRKTCMRGEKCSISQGTMLSKNLETAQWYDEDELRSSKSNPDMRRTIQVLKKAEYLCQSR